MTPEGKFLREGGGGGGGGGGGFSHVSGRRGAAGAGGLGRVRRAPGQGGTGDGGRVKRSSGLQLPSAPLDWDRDLFCPALQLIPAPRPKLCFYILSIYLYLEFIFINDIV